MNRLQKYTSHYAVKFAEQIHRLLSNKPPSLLASDNISSHTYLHPAKQNNSKIEFTNFSHFSILSSHITLKQTKLHLDSGSIKKLPPKPRVFLHYTGNRAGLVIQTYIKLGNLGIGIRIRRYIKHSTTFSRI